MPTILQEAARVSAFDSEQRNIPVFRSPPHNFEAEKALLGALLANNNAYDRVSDFLTAEHFADGVHGRIYDAMRRLIERGQVADPITLKMLFEQDGTLAEVGGPRYLAELAASMVSIINATDYARLIYDLFLKRQLIDIGEQVVNSAYEPEQAAEEQIAEAEDRLYKLAETGEFDTGFKPFVTSMREAVEAAQMARNRDGQLSGVGSGFRDLDNLLGGLHRSDLIILAARPSMGKTALATNIAFNAAQSYRAETGPDGKLHTVNGAVVGFFSLEMSAEQLAARILSEYTGVASDRMRRGKLTNEEFDQLVEACRMLSNLPLFIDDTPALSVSMLRTRAKRLKREKNLGMIIVDYLQLMQGSAGNRDNRVLEIGEITRGLKNIAKELNIPVVALSQLSRAVEQREDKRPQLADLRESGTIEQDADVVMFIYREAYYLERSEPKESQYPTIEKFTAEYERWQDRMERVRNIADVIIGKQRHGPTDTVSLQFTGELTRFSDLDTQHLDRYRD